MKNFCILILCAFFCAQSISIIAQSQDKMIKVKVKSKTGDQNVQIQKEGDTQVIFINENQGDVEISAADFIKVDAGNENGEKEVSVDVESKVEDGEEKRVVTITIVEKDKKEVIKWEDDGKTIPENIQAQLKESGVDVNILGGDEADNQSKSVSVNVEAEVEDGIEKRKVSVTILEKGTEKIIEWDDQGEIPADIKSRLEKEGVDINVISGEAQEDTETEETIEIQEKMGKDGEKGAKTITIKKRMGSAVVEEGQDGQKKIIKWDGDGEIPEEVRKVLEADGTSLQELMSEDGEGTKSVKVKMISGSDMQMEEWDGAGELPDDIKKILEEEGVDIDDYRDADGEKKIFMMKKATEDDGSIKVEEAAYQIKYIDENGEEKILNWNGEGEMPAEMKKIMEENKLLKKGE